jgi:hypothetical protein
MVAPKKVDGAIVVREKIKAANGLKAGVLAHYTQN